MRVTQPSLGRRARDVSPSEYAAADTPDQYDLTSKADDWRTIARDGTDVRVRTPGSQNQAYIEREGTFAFLMSETLTGEQMTARAAGLKPGAKHQEHLAARELCGRESGLPSALRQDR